MSKVTHLPGRQAEAGIQFEQSFYKMDYSNNTVSFTEEGRRYYEGWFKRFGFALSESDAKTFIEAVMHINRQVAKLLPEDLEREINAGGMSEDEKALWSKYLAQDYEGFAADLSALAEKPQDSAPDNVVQFLSRK